MYCPSAPGFFRPRYLSGPGCRSGSWIPWRTCRRPLSGRRPCPPTVPPPAACGGKDRGRQPSTRAEGDFSSISRTDPPGWGGRLEGLPLSGKEHTDSWDETQQVPGQGFKGTSCPQGLSVHNWLPAGAFFASSSICLQQGRRITSDLG